jgi:hypothetical protein
MSTDVTLDDISATYFPILLCQASCDFRPFNLLCEVYNTRLKTSEENSNMNCSFFYML